MIPLMLPRPTRQPCGVGIDFVARIPGEKHGVGFLEQMVGTDLVWITFFSIRIGKVKRRASNRSKKSESTAPFATYYD